MYQNTLHSQRCHKGVTHYIMSISISLSCSMFFPSSSYLLSKLSDSKKKILLEVTRLKNNRCLIATLSPPWVPRFVCSARVHSKGEVHFQNENFLIICSPHVIQDAYVVVHDFLSSVAKKLKSRRFFRKTFQDFSPYSGLQWGPICWRSKLQFKCSFKGLYTIPAEK